MSVQQIGKSTTSGRRGGSLIELLVAVAAGSLVLTFVVVMFISGQASYVGLGNYAELSNQSRLALDWLSRDVREATQVVSWQSNAASATLVLTNANKGIQTAYTWNTTNGILSCSRTGQANQTCLTGCDSWSFSFYQRNPNNNWTFYPATNLAQCKLINMSWKCSRQVIGRKINTENLVTAQVVLRNKL